MSLPPSLTHTSFYLQSTWVWPNIHVNFGLHQAYTKSLSFTAQYPAKDPCLTSISISTNFMSIIQDQLPSISGWTSATRYTISIPISTNSTSIIIQLHSTPGQSPTITRTTNAGFSWWWWWWWGQCWYEFPKWTPLILTAPPIMIYLCPSLLNHNLLIAGHQRFWHLIKNSTCISHSLSKEVVR